MDPNLAAVTAELARAGKDFHARGWVLGTSGNFSALVSRDPLRLAITPSGADKGDLSSERFLEIDATGRVVGTSQGRPSDEHLLHLEVVTSRGAGSVLHTHSVWSTLLSDAHGDASGMTLEGYEMLKGLEGVSSHRHREWLPILENDQDIPALSTKVRSVLREQPGAHGFLLRRHGLYTWGRTVREARRHVEILEFLLEAEGRSRWQSSESPNRI